MNTSPAISQEIEQWTETGEIHGQEFPDSIEDDPPIALTDAKSKPIRVAKIEYTNILKPFPDTDPHGFAYVVHVGSQSPEEVKEMWHDIQYSKNKKYPERAIFCSFLQTPVTKYTYGCSGVKICENLIQSLRLLNHTTVTEDILKDLQESQRLISLVEDDQTKRNAYSFYRSVQLLFVKELACVHFSQTCKAVFKRHQIPDVTGHHAPYIGCVNSSSSDPHGHFYRAVQGVTQLDVEFLEKICNQEILAQTEECSVIESMDTRRKHCGFDHPQGSGRLKKLPCGVTFNIFIPADLRICPYMLFVSHGIHTHPPPPPNRPPEKIMKDLVRLIHDMKNPGLTLAGFLKSPTLEDFCRRYNCDTLAEIHASFSNMDRFTALLRKQRLAAFPAGQAYNGVLFEIQRKPSLKEYVQETFFDEEGVMIICLLKEQAELLLTLSSFEIDMSYKRIKSKKMNEVVFATYLSQHGKIVTLCRIFTEQETTQGYRRLFTRVFSLIRKVTGQEVRFYPIHGGGIHALILDMCTKQMAGLGEYLSDIDPQRRNWRWHLKNIVIFCHVHFFRSIANVVGTKNRGTSVYNRMASLLNCESERDYYQLCELLLENETNPKVQTWAVHKQNPVIAAGLNKFCSGISHRIYDSMRNHTNSAEQTHNKSYAFGLQQNLLQALLSAWKLDKRDMVQYDARNKHGIRHSYKPSNMTEHYFRHMSREESLKRKRSATDQNADEDIEEASAGGLQAPSSRPNRGNRSSPQGQLRRVATENLREETERQFLIRKQELELQLMEQDLKQKQLANERVAIELEERRERLQKELLYKCPAPKTELAETSMKMTENKT